MVAAGEWPEPGLLEAIAARGDEAVEPLLDVVQRDAHGWPEEAPLCHAIGLLGDLHARSAIPVLCDLVRRYDNETLQYVSEALLAFGAEAVEPTLEAARDRSLSWYSLSTATNVARQAAGDDPVIRARVAEVFREILVDFLARKEELDGEDAEKVAAVIGDLAAMADPLAHEPIKAAFAADIVDEWIIGQDDVERTYEKGGDRVESVRTPFLKVYTNDYERYMAPASQRGPDTVSGPIPAPIRSTERRPGRNDPCWCGSGKKYKKCHLPLDQA
jgi:hypothetical protein